MLCYLCETFLSNILAADFANWKRIREGEEKWFTFRLNNHTGVLASAAAGCEVCSMFNWVRNGSIRNYEGLAEKWHIQQGSIDVKHQNDSPERSSRWTFQLLTAAPEMSWIAFEIFQPESADDVDIDASGWPREVSASPTSSTSIRIANQWIQDCLTTHALCTRPDLAPLPTRVLDVGRLDETSNPRLHIGNGEAGRYVTLSHCWGTGYRTKLTKNNLHKFENAILLDRLPQTFRDAIHLTRLLGVRYLWIDALCIIQDDEKDWKRESASMCSVFENAVFSISAVAATDSHSGMLHNRCPDQVKVEINGMRVGVRQKIDSLDEAMVRSRLETRAWAYQERLLPKGILHVAPAQMYWECASCTASETLPTGQISNATEDSLTRLPFDSTASASYSSKWLHLVSVYSTRQVTRASDRLPAIAGLSEKAKKEKSISMYMQGLWANDLHAGLLWKRQLTVYGKLIPSRDKYLAR